MMGMQTSPARLFYDFCLDDHVPGDHLLRRIDQFLELETVRSELKPFYSTIGRPSIDPELMMRMLIVGYCMGIRSERRLCDEVHLNLAYRWFCRLGLDGKVPDHSTFSRNRHGRFRQSDILRHLFEAVVGRCLREGLVGGEGFAVDASLIAADANKQRSIPGDQWRVDDLGADAGQAVREYLATLDDAAFGAASEVTPKFISPSGPGTLLPTAPMARLRTWPGWSRSGRSNRTSRCSTSPTGPTAPSRDPTSSSTLNATTTPAHRAICWCSSGEPSRRRARASPKTERGYTDRASLIARAAPSRRSAVRTRRSAKCRVTSTKMLVMSSELWQTRRPTNVRGIAGRRSRCCSPISSASLDSVASDCAAPTAHETNSSSPPPPKT
ncbi:transposase [Nitrobacteraceae bacterium AZCC 2146]